MKVLLLAHHFDRPEANLALQLSKQGVELVVRCEADSPFQEVLRQASQSLESIHIGSRLSPLAVFKIRSVLLRHHIQLVHSLSSRALSNALLASSGLPVAHVAYRGTVGHLSHWDPSSWLSYLHPRLARISCVSQAVQRYMLSLGIAPHKPVLIYKGHELAWYKAAPRSMRLEFGMPENAVVIACCANMRAVKGADVLIEAAAQVLPQRDAHLLLIGEARDPRVRLLVSQFPAPDRIHLAGFRRDAAALVGACDIAVVPSREREGLPKAAIEAMAQGVALVASDVGGLPELVQDRVSGLVVPAGNPHALARALQELLQSPTLRASLGQAARERIAGAFALENTVQQTLALYRDALREGLPKEGSPKALHQGDCA